MTPPEDRRNEVTGAAASAGDRDRPLSIEVFLDEPTRSLGAWRRLWDEDLRFPIRSHRGPLGWLLVRFKRLLRPLVATPQNDLWERQRVYNLIVLERLEGRDEMERRLTHLEALVREGLEEVMQHNDALFSRVDLKLDRYRRDARELTATLRSALAVTEGRRLEELQRADAEIGYRRLEDRHRGTREEIAARISNWLPRLEGRQRVLDLGCGRGEALDVLRGAGHDALGVDASAEMVRACTERGLRAVHADVFAYLETLEPASLDAVVSFHVIEHLPADSLSTLVRLAYRCLTPGGLLLLETPSPLSLVAGARNFWLDPTHQRPVHPSSLRLSYEAAGFEGVERVDVNAFASQERLPQLSLEGLSAEQQELADRINRVRDRLDDLLYGFQDYGMIGRRPS